MNIAIIIYVTSLKVFIGWLLHVIKEFIALMVWLAICDSGKCRFLAMLATPSACQWIKSLLLGRGKSQIQCDACTMPRSANKIG